MACRLIQLVISNLKVYLDCLLKTTRMACLTPIEGDCGFLSANLYAKSIFGEDALINVSVEQVEEGSPITGHIRIRSKTRGISLSMGAKITEAQI